MLERVSLADASEGAYSAMDAAESEPIEVMEGLPELLRTKNCDTEVFIEEGRVEVGGEVGRAAALWRSSGGGGEGCESIERSESIRLSIRCR